MNRDKKYTFKEFKDFLTEKCFDLEHYKNGKYDRKIYNWFDLGKPQKITFCFKTSSSRKGFEKFKGLKVKRLLEVGEKYKHAIKRLGKT